MADSILDSLWSLITPKAAEAKIVGGDAEMTMLGEVMRSNAAGKGQYLPDQYRRVIAAAQAHPATVTLEAAPGMMAGQSPRTGGVPITAGYLQDRRILYDPGLPKADLPNTIAHELTHFLNYNSPRPQGPAAQHALIKQMLGRDVYDPDTSLEGYQPGAVSPIDQAVWRRWLGGVPEAWEGGAKVALLETLTICTPEGIVKLGWCGCCAVPITEPWWTAAEVAVARAAWRALWLRGLVRGAAPWEAEEGGAEVDDA